MRELATLKAAQARVVVWRRIMAVAWLASLMGAATGVFSLGVLVYALVWGTSADGLSGMGLLAVGVVLTLMGISAVAECHSDDGQYAKALAALDCAEEDYDNAVRRLAAGGL